MGDAYDIGGCSIWKNFDIVYVICQVLAELIGEPEEKFSGLISFVQDRLEHDWRYAIDATKIQQKLGWYPTETFATGMRKTAK